MNLERYVIKRQGMDVLDVLDVLDMLIHLNTEGT